ncbi:structural constituent of cytoskeleton [Trebouxia sp. C0010 RCD-2024]
METIRSRQVDMEQLQQAYPARTATRTYSLIQRMQDKAAELEQQSEIASAGTLHSSGSSAAQDALKSTSLARQPTRAPRSFMFSSTDNAADMKEDGGPSAALALSVTQNTSNTLRSTTAKLGKHQTMTMTSVSRSTGRSDKAKRAQEQHEQDMLEELDRLHEECASRHEDAQRHQDSYMRRELQWEATVARLQQQLAQLKGEGNHKAAEDAAEGQAKQLNTIRGLHKEVVAGIDEAMARHAKETDRVDLLTLKQLKARVNALEQQIVQDKARQLTEEEVYEQRSAGVRQELEAMTAAAARFDALHQGAAAEVARLKAAQGLEQGQAHMLLKQGVALKRDNHLLKEDLASAEAELAGWYETMQRETHALKRLYQQDPTHESLKPKAGPAGSDHAVGDSLAAQAAVEGTDSDRVIPEWLTKGRQQMKSGEKGDRVAARQLPQVALLREKLAKEQQRARAAEAMLAAQHQMQQLLQGIVQAVLLARSSMQEQGDRPQGSSRNGGVSLHTSVSATYRGYPNNTQPRPSSAAHASRISLSTGGVRVTPAGSVLHPFPDPPVSTFAKAESVSSDADMQCSAVLEDDVMQRQVSRLQGSASALSPTALNQGFRGSTQAPYLAQSPAKQPLSGSSKAPRRPQSAAHPSAVHPPAMTPTAQPPFWTGCMQLESSHQPSEHISSGIYAHDAWQHPGTNDNPVQQSTGQMGGRQRPQSASPRHAAGAASSGRSARSTSQSELVASSPCTALRTVPEDTGTALQPCQPLFTQAAIPEGRAGSLRAWRGMYSQATLSQVGAGDENNQGSRSGASGASDQHYTVQRPASTARTHSVSRSTHASRPHSTQAQDVQRQQSEARRGAHTLDPHTAESQAKGHRQGRPASAGVQAGMLPESAGRGTVGEEEGREAGAALDLTKAERRLVVEQLLGMPQFVALVSSQVCSTQQKPAWPDMLPASLSRPVSPAAQVTAMKHLLQANADSLGSLQSPPLTTLFA